MEVWLESHLGHQLGRNNFCSGRKVEVVSLFQSIGSGQRWELSSMLPISWKLTCSNIQKKHQIQMALFIPNKRFRIQNICRKVRESIMKSTMEAFTPFLTVLCNWVSRKHFLCALKNTFSSPTTVIWRKTVLAFMQPCFIHRFLSTLWKSGYVSLLDYCHIMNQA